MRKLIPLLTHREEPAREKATSLLSYYCVLYVIYSYSQYSSFLRSAEALQSSSSAEDSTVAYRSSLLYKHLADDSLVEQLKGIEKSVPRSHEKVVQSVWSLAFEVSETMQQLREQWRATQTTKAVVAVSAPKTPAKSPRSADAASSAAGGGGAVAPNSEVKVVDMQSALGLLRANSKTGLTRSNSRKLRRSGDEAPNGNPTGSSSSLLSTASGSPSTSDVTDTESSTPRLLGASPEDISRHVSGRVSPRASLQMARQHDLQYAGGALSSDKIAGKIKDLSNSWYEVQLLLKSSPANEQQWKELCSVVKNSKDLFPSVIHLANSVNTPVGSILRAILPFDENTSSNNQAAIGKKASESFGSLPSHLLSNSAVVSQLTQLRSLVVDFRRMIRVKIADEADMKQAMTAAQMLNKFVGDLELVAENRKQSVSEVVTLLV